MFETQHPATEQAARLRKGLAELADTPLLGVPNDELMPLARELTGVVAAAQAALLRLIAHVDAVGVTERGMYRSTREWVATELNVEHRQARRLAALASALHGPRATTGAVLAAGEMSLEHAVVIVEAVQALPDDVEPAIVTQAEEHLVTLAVDHDPQALRRLGERILTVVAPEVGEAKLAADLERDERRARAGRTLSWFDDGQSSVVFHGRLDTVSAAPVLAALGPLSAPRPADGGEPDSRPAGARRADALVEVCRRMLAGGQVPDSGGLPTTVVVTIPLRTLTDGLASATLDDGTALSPAAARRMACDAQLIPTVLGADSAILDVGRGQRLFSGPRRRALNLRDRGCAFPGCDRPPSWCQAHHIRHWTDGGTTTIGNGVLLCDAHHDHIHDGGWTVRLAADGRPEFVPPSWLDRGQRPRRNTRHHPMAA